MGGMPQDHNLSAAEICRIIVQKHSLELSAGDRKFPAVSGTFPPKPEISARDCNFQLKARTFHPKRSYTQLASYGRNGAKQKVCKI
jgi:hypothetical protein